MQGMLTVDGRGADAEEPDTAGAITAKDYTFEIEDVEAGDNIVQFQNQGREFHHIVAAPVAPGATVEDATAFFESEEEPTGPPPIDFEAIVTSAVIGPGQDIRTTMNFQPGQYVLACFISDRGGGEPHVALGMISSAQID
jgi:hypothetical protein